MKKDSNKLTFNKEKVANLSSADLENVVGGQADDHSGSTRGVGTCQMCTTLTAPTTEGQA